MIKRTSIIIALIVAMVFGVHAQNNPQQLSGEIVMTKSELASFLARIATIKKKKMQEDRKKADQEKLAQLRLGYYGYQPHATSSSSGRNADLIKEIMRLNARIDYLMATGRADGGNTTTLVTPQGASGGYYPYHNPQPKTIVVEPQAAELKHKLDSVQTQLDALLGQANPSSDSEEISKLNRQIEDLQRQLLAESTLSEEDAAVLKRYGSTKLQVFFANNVAEVAPQYKDEVKRAAEILKENPQLTVVLKGYASTRGNPRYNYDLSMRRNESVKRMLIDYGVFPDQISSIFYGEDASTSESVARRVDMNFIIK